MSLLRGALPCAVMRLKHGGMQHERQTCDDQITLRLPQQLRDRIEAAAADEGRSAANLMRRVLERQLADERGAGGIRSAHGSD